MATNREDMMSNKTTLHPNGNVALELSRDEAYLVLMCLRKLRFDPSFEEDDQDKISDVIDALLEVFVKSQENA